MSFEKGNDSRDDLPPKPDGKLWNAKTTYETELCGQLLELMSKGLSYSQCAAEMKIPLSTMEKWCKIHPEFGEAWKHGRTLAMAWWEKAAQDHLILVEGKDMPKTKFSDSTFLYTMKARFRQKEDNNVKINVDGSIETDAANVKMDELTKKYMAKDT